MRSLLIGCIAATTLGVAVAGAQSTNAGDKAAQPAATSNTSAANTTFIDKQETGLVRAPKLVGVAVYDSNNKSVGKVADILLDKSGAVKAVVIGVGGFLGIGSKDVAVPYDAVHWQTEERTVATNEPPPGGTPGQTGAMNAPMDKAGATKKIDAAETEAYQGYPDRAVVDVSQDQLKAAPEFKYASNPETKVGTTGDGVPATPAQKP
jgi:sporulation protein YlmC with PRC-barrel domain